MILDYIEEVQEYYTRGIKDNRNYLIVMCDDFNYEYYPVYLDTIKECNKYIEEHDGINMTSFKTLFDLATGEVLRGR